MNYLTLLIPKSSLSEVRLLQMEQVTRKLRQKLTKGIEVRTCSSLYFLQLLYDTKPEGLLFVK